MIDDLLLVPTRHYNEINCSTAKKNFAHCLVVSTIVTNNELCCKTMSGQRGIHFDDSKTIWTGLFVHPCPLFTSKKKQKCHMSSPKATQTRWLDVHHFGRFGLKDTHQINLRLTPKMDLHIMCQHEQNCHEKTSDWEEAVWNWWFGP